MTSPQQIVEMDDDPDISQYPPFDFVPIRSITNCDIDSQIDICACVLDPGVLGTVIVAASQREAVKRTLVITDESREANMELTLWGKHAEDFKISCSDPIRCPPIIVVRRCRVNGYHGRSLSTVSSHSHICFFFDMTRIT